MREERARVCAIGEPPSGLQTCMLCLAWFPGHVESLLCWAWE